jgi:hypothetical protein
MTFRRSAVLFLLTLTSFGSPLAALAGDGPADPTAALRAEHPRLLFTKEDQARIETLARTDALLARLIEQNNVNAGGMLKTSSVRYEIPDGKRLLSQSRKCIERVASMAMAHRLTGERRFVDGAVKEMLIASKFKDWNPSHFLDTAEMTTALAIGYDWLYDEIQPADRQTIREAVVRLGLNPGMKCYRDKGWWVAGHNNWNQVCNGGMIMGALAVAEDEKQLADDTVRLALKSIPNGVGVYNPSGAYPEGPGYWQYGTAYTCLTTAALRTALGHDFGISRTPGLNETGRFRIHTVGPLLHYFNYADSGSSYRPASAMFELARLYDNRVYAWWHRHQLAKFVPAEGALKLNCPDRFFALEIAWYDPRGDRPSDAELSRDAFFESAQDAVTMRSAWDDPHALYVGFKGGDNRVNHGHLDIGSFVLDAQGVRWVLDLGSDDYNMPGYFGGKRWQYYRMNNRSHNTLVIGDKIQNPKAASRVTAFKSTPERTVAVIDMTDAYSGQVKSARRGMEMLDGRAVHVRDELTGLKEPVRWGIVTEARIELDGNTAVLTQDGKTLRAEILEPAGAKFQIVSTKPPTAQEKQNKGTQMLAITIEAGPSGNVALSVLMQPETGAKPVMVKSPQDLLR